MRPTCAHVLYKQRIGLAVVSTDKGSETRTCGFMYQEVALPAGDIGDICVEDARRIVLQLTGDGQLRCV